MKRPLVYIALSFICGIIAFDSSIIVTVLCCFAVIGLSVFLIRKNHILGIFIPLVTVLGFWNCYIESKTCIDFENMGNFEGIVIRKTDNSFVLDSSEKIMVYCKTTDGIYIGNRIFLQGTPERLSRSENPYGYDAYRTLSAQKIKAIIYNPEIKNVSEDKNLYYFTGRIKERLESVFDENLPPRYAGIMKAVMTGNTSSLDSYTKEIYKCAGMYHILVISGMHIAILSGFIMSALKVFGKRISLIFSAVAIMLYCLFIGSGVACARAGIMFFVLIAGKLCGRNRDDISSICLAVLMILIDNPFELFYMGFQYSFCSVLAISLVYKPIYESLNEKYQNPLVSAFLISFSVCLCIKPITAYYFYYFNTADVFINTLLSPFTSVLVIYGFITAFGGILCPLFGKITATQINAILIIFEKVFSFADKFPLFLTGRVSLIEIILFYLAVFLAVRYIIDKEKKILHLCVFLSLFTLTAVLPFSRYIGKSGTETVFLSVGQGDCTVMRNRNMNFVFDCGDSYGESVSYLNAEGQNTAEAVFISHSDSDHSRGFKNLADSIKIKNVVLPDIPDDMRDEEYRQIENICREREINIIYALRGESFHFGKSAFTVLSPSPESINDSNSGSLVIKASYGKTSFLFTGDIPSEVERSLTKLDISADVLKVAHHGSKYSSDTEFLKAVNPKIAVISVGKNNVYGHPSPQTIKRLEELGIPYSVTAYDNAVTIISDGKTIKKVKK